MYRLSVSKHKNLVLLIDILVILIIVEPAYLSRFELLDSVYKIAKISVGAIILFYFFAVKRKIDLYTVLVIGFEMLLLFSTIINSGSVYAWFQYGAYVILMLYIEIMIDIDVRVLMKALSIALGMYVHINLLTRLLYPGGLYIDNVARYANNWFLGYDNLSVIIIMLSQTVSAFRIYVNRGKTSIWDITVIISGVTFILIQQIATGILAECLFLAYIFVTKSAFIQKIIGKAKVIVLGMFILFILIQFFNIQRGGLITLIFRLLGKNATFTGRSLIWQKAWREIISEWPVFGFGVHKGLEYVKHFGHVACTHLHCNYLQVLYEGGLVGEVLLFSMLFYPAYRFDNSAKTYSSMVFLGGLAAILLIWQVEAYSAVTTYCIVVLTLLNYSNKIERKIVSEPQKENIQSRTYTG